VYVCYVLKAWCKSHSSRSQNALKQQGYTQGRQSPALAKRQPA